MHVNDRLYTCTIVCMRVLLHVYDRLYACTIARIRSFVYVQYYTYTNKDCIRVLLRVYKLSYTCNSARIQTGINDVPTNHIRVILHVYV